MIPLLTLASAFGLVSSVALVALTRRWARRRQLLDHPNERSLHHRPTPRGGGIGIVLPTVTAIIVAAASLDGAGTWSLWLAGLALSLAIVGFLDDLRNLSATVRLVIQIAVAAAFVWAVSPWNVVHIPGAVPLDLGFAAAAFTVVFLVWISNAYNFMDGIDGLAGVQGLIAGFGWVLVGYQLNDPLIVVGGAAVLFACLGFLFFNWPPASIFMGDVGTGFLGFLFGGLTVYASTRSPAAAAAGVAFVWPFLFDTLFTIARRATRGENLLRAHRSHLYQRLVLTGCSHRAVTLLYGGLAASGALIGAASLGTNAWSGLWYALPLLAGAIWLLVLIRERSAR
jgi:Fuc2NAc and GlcNAc transferase